MKKLVFAVEVFGLMAMFAAAVILEMNHTKGGSSESNSTSSIKQKIEIINICMPENDENKITREAFPITQKTFSFIKTF
jgi:hypothetical protein